MDEVERRQTELIHSPLGCAFLILAAKSALGVSEIAQPPVSHRLAAMAEAELDIFKVGHQQLVSYALRQGPPHSDLARALLESGEVDWWFAPCDLQNQVWAPQEQGYASSPPGPHLIRDPQTPVSRWEKYAQKPASLTTSTFVGGSVSWLLGMEETAGDLEARQYPVLSWSLKAESKPRVYEVDGPDDWHHLCTRYPAPGEGLENHGWSQEGQVVPDWQAIATEWDAVHLSFGGLLTSEQVRIGSPDGWSNHYFWDAEATAWLRWIFAEPEKRPDHHEPELPAWRKWLRLVV